MDNKAIAGILYETADLLEIDGQDSFRIRSYRNAAQAIEALPQQISELISEPKKILEIPGIGKGMLTNMQEMFKEGRLSLHAFPRHRQRHADEHARDVQRRPALAACRVAEKVSALHARSSESSRP